LSQYLDNSQDEIEKESAVNRLQRS